MDKNRIMDDAIGAVTKEWKHMARLAVQIREGRNNNPEWVENQQSKFTGIFKRLLTDPIEDVKKEM